MSTPCSLSPDQQAALTKSQKEGRAVSLWTVGIFCIFGWDYFMCLPKEIRYIWRKKLSYVSLLYIANRYFGLIQGAVAIWVMEISNTGPQAETCKKIFRWQPAGAMVLTLLSQAIMASRVYAIYGLSKIILGLLATIMAIEFAIHTYTITRVYPAPSPTGITIPCVAIGPLGFLVAFWAIPLFFDTVTFGLTLFKSFTYWREELHIPTISLIFRDGLIYFAAIFSMNLINVVIFVTQDSTLQSINLPATIRLNVIMSCRLVLNLREERRPSLHLPGSSSFPSGGERQAPAWKNSFNTYELSSRASTSVAATSATRMEPEV